MSADEFSLAADFEAYPRERWESEVLKVMNRRRPPGREMDLEQAMAALRTTTVEGIDIEPLYLNDQRALGHPGIMPFVRGTTVRTGGMDAWDVRQLHENPDPAASRKAVLTDLERGVTGLWLRVGEGAIAAADLPEVLADVLPDLVTMTVSSNDDQNGAAAALLNWWNATSAKAPQGNLGLDTYALAARGGAIDPRPGQDWVARCLHDLPGVRAIMVDVLPHHDAGASDVDELAIAIATGVAHLRHLEDAGISPDRAFGQIEFRVSATADQFLTIARLRALRLLWARVGEVSGVPAHQRGARQHAVTSWRMMTRDDPWVNMLRTTVACFSASVGGAEAITVLPFDTVHGLPNDFSRRIARNTQVILAEESNIGRVNDPAGGSWYVESLTDSLAARAWELFQEIERAGGMAKALPGLVADRIAASAAERDRRLAVRQASITGVSAFPNPTEPALEREPRPEATVNEGSLPRRRDAEMFEALRDRSAQAIAQTGRRPAVFLATIGMRRDYGARETFTSSLLGVAGLDCPQTEGTDPAVIAEGFVAAQTPIAVVCSSTAMYAEHGPAVIAALREAGARKILLAGKAKELGEGHEDLVDGVLHVGVNVLTLLTGLQDDLELPSRSQEENK